MMMVMMYCLHFAISPLSLPSFADNSRTADVMMVNWLSCGWCRLLSVRYRIGCQNKKISPNNNTVQYLRILPSAQ